MKKPTAKQLHCLKVLSEQGAHSPQSAIKREDAWKLISGDPNRTRGFGPLKYCREVARWVLDDDRPSGRFLYLSDSGRAVLAQHDSGHILVKLGNPTPPRNPERIADDIDEIEQTDGISATQRRSLINARLGQGNFRMKVLAKWNNRCCVTGSQTLAAIRASHIKPWRDCSDKERLDPDNGLPLVATLDALFDAHLITFDKDGELLISKQLTDEEITCLGLADRGLSETPNARTAKFLAGHREEFHRMQQLIE